MCAEAFPVPIITTSRLSKRYGERIGVESLDLSVPEGCLFGFLGPNGAGKTTAIRILMGLLRPASGEAAVLSKDCWRAGPELRRDVGYLPGDLRLYPWMTARMGLGLFGRFRRTDLRAKGDELLGMFDLNPDVPARKMSQGMRQKLGLILAMAHEPRLLILDEPTTGLDPIMQETLAEHLRSLRRVGRTVFFSSHTLSAVERLCDRVAIVREGRIVADETIDALRARAHRQVRIDFASDASPPDGAPAFLDLRSREGNTWHGEVDGESGALLAWLEGKPVRDLSISPPDLESLFHSFYRDDGGTGA